MIMLGAGKKPAADAAEPDMPDEESLPPPTDAQKEAARVFAKAVSGGDPAAIVRAFRALDMSCGDDY
jgi:hypothetical protein